MRLPVVASFLACGVVIKGSPHWFKSPRGPYPTVRYKRTTICETTEGVNSYSGYIDLDEQSHLFFWFFEARQDPETVPITLWLNGGPGSDSLLGLFTGMFDVRKGSYVRTEGWLCLEVGPCTVNPDLTTSLNPFSWSETSNLLFLSQPLRVGFSYQQINATSTDTTELAAIGAWQAIQAFLAELPRMNPRTRTRDLNLWTERWISHLQLLFRVS
jgi:carboxypeptidase D